MSAITNTQLYRAVRFYEASIGKKVVMAITGVILFGYVLGHLVGNLQVFAGPEQINKYAHFLHSNPGPLWAVRLVLLLAVVLHITASIQLTRLKWAARPVSYTKKDDIPASYAARTMMWSGPIIAAFVVFHILHLTTGDVLPIDENDVYSNIALGFQHPWISVSYIVAVWLLGMHLYHGVWSMFQSVGINHPRYTPKLKRMAAVFAIAITVGYVSIPVSVWAGLVKPESIHATRR